MDKLKVAVIMEDCLPSEGGGYFYYQKLLTAINNHTFNEEIEIVNLNFYDEVPEHLKLNKEIINVKKTFFGELTYRFSHFLYKVIHRLFDTNAKQLLESISRFMHSINNRAARKIIEKQNIDLVYYLNPEENVLNYPMIVTHWDVGHKSMYPFPEVAWNGDFEKREKYYQKILSSAFLILCESDTGAKELQKYYPVNPDKIKVLPLFSSDVVTVALSEEKQSSILSGYNLLKQGYFMYPAQFWAHKNHYTLIHAFRALLMEPGNKSLKLVLCGSDHGNLAYIKTLIDSLQLNNNILIPGFVSDQNLYALYKSAIALVMPTFLGPTNIPLIEAAELECAVICSDLEGHREILGDNALYFDPSDANALNDCMQKILDVDLRKKLIASGYRHISESAFQLERSIPLLDRFLQQVRPVRKAWGVNLKLLFAFAKIGILSFN